MEPEGSLSCSQDIVFKPRVTFRNKMVLYGEEVLAPCSTPMLENHPFLAIRDY
jgi:hypothetical protein